MSGSLNRAQIMGHLGKDPEIRRTQDGKPIANFSVATSESWRDKNSGERKERTEWHRCTCFNEALSGVIEKYLKKGSYVYIEGTIRTRKWTDQQGVDKYATEIVLEQFNSTLKMLDKTGSGPPPADENSYSQAKPKEGGSGGRSFARDLDDEVPFAPQVL